MREASAKARCIRVFAGDPAADVAVLQALLTRFGSRCFLAQLHIYCELADDVVSLSEYIEIYLVIVRFSCCFWRR